MLRRSLRGATDDATPLDGSINALRTSSRLHSRSNSRDWVNDATQTGSPTNRTMQPVPSTSKATPEPQRPSKRQKTGDSAPVIAFDTECSFCDGNVERNREGKPEAMISCTRCGSSGHFSCLHMQNPRLIDTVRSYDWRCMECKLCEVCNKESDDLLFCDRCDRGWHGRCLNPPLAKAPKGSWICPMCRRVHIDKPPKNGHKVRLAHPLPTARPSSQIRTTSVRRFANGIGDTSEDDDLRSAPSRNVVAGSIGTAKQNSPRQRQRQKRKQDKGKERAFDVGVGDPAASAGPRIKLPNGFFGGTSVPSAGNLRVRLKLPTSEGPTYEEPEEILPYGGILQGDAASADDREPTKEDRTRFNKARTVVETRLAAATASDFISARPLPLKHANTSALPLVSQRMPDFSMLDSAGGYLRGRPPTVPATPTDSMPGTPALPDGHFSNVKLIRFGDYEIKTWYQAPYPEEYARVPDGRLWLCEFCLKYMKTSFSASRHKLKCKNRHPPGDEIYRSGNVSVFEVDGRKSKIYCQNLCLLAKMFLDHKTLYYDVDPFLFYVMTENDADGAQFVGYFSKEKRSPTNNVSCIMTLPVRQRRGWGNLLVDFSYLLSRKEGRVGTPEKPLSDLGLVTYRNYWILSIYRAILDMPEDKPITIEEISRRTSITHEEVYYILRDRHLIHEGVSVPPSPVPIPSEPASPGALLGKQRRPQGHRRPGRGDADDDDEIIVPTIYAIGVDRAALAAHVAAFDAKGYLTLQPDRLKWTPFLTTRFAPVPPALPSVNEAKEKPLPEQEDTAPIEILEVPGEKEPVIVDDHGVEIATAPTPIAMDVSDEGEVPVTPPAPVSTRKRKDPSSRSTSPRKRARRDGGDAEVAEILLPSRHAVRQDEGESEDSGVAF